MTDLYANIGVDKKASRKEIKAAYRQRAKQLHPDRGGNPEQFGALKKAYDILSDATRRARYDATGDESEAAPDNTVANMTSILGAVFSQVLAECAGRNQNPLEIDFCGFMRGKLQEGIVQFEKQIRISKNMLETDRRLAGRFSKKGDETPNIFEGLIKNRIRDMEINIANMQKSVESTRKALALLESYRFRNDPAPRQSAVTLGGMNFMNMGGFLYG